MSDYIEPHTEEEMSTTSQYSLTRFDEPEVQLPSTVEFKTDTDGDAEPLASTMEACTDSEGDAVMECGCSTASLATQSCMIQSFCFYPYLSLNQWHVLELHLFYNQLCLKSRTVE